LLGAGVRVIEEGLNGRTTVHDDPLEEGRNGRTYLLPCLLSHQPIDIVVLMLGCNDLKTRFALPAGDIADGAAQLARSIQLSGTGPDGGAPRVLLVSPPPVADLKHLPELDAKFSGAAEKVRLLPPLYERAAKALGCAYLDCQQVVKGSRIDGLHLEAADHAKLGRAIADAVRGMTKGAGRGLRRS